MLASTSIVLGTQSRSHPLYLRIVLPLIGFLFSNAWLFAQPEAFITTWKTDNFGTSNSTSIAIPTTGSGYNYEVDWNNDGIYDQSGITGGVTHNFGTAGTYTIRIRGAFPRIYFNGGGDCRKILDVNQWGSIAWASMGRAFSGCVNLDISATDVPDLSGVMDMSVMFARCSSLNGPANIGTWNTSSVTSMELTFSRTDIFDQPIGNWDVVNVANMNGMFYQAHAFNQPIGTWNTGAVTDMGGMFRGATVFDQPIGAWNTASVSSMSVMFEDAIAFNQPIGTWNTAAVRDMSGMFARASAFNQPIGAWNTASVMDMWRMFNNATSFDQPIGAWNTSSVTNMDNLFYQASAFNQPIGAWNTAAVTDMESMLYQASAFNQSIGAWTLHASVAMSGMLNNCGMDCANYSATLIGWANNPATPSGRSPGVVGLSYGTNAGAAKNSLITTKGWSIFGDVASGTVCALPPQPNEFITTWNTNNSGTSNSTSITIPTTGSGYNYAVDWDNDGNYDESGITGSVTHDFGTAGTYTIRIRGAFPRIYFNNSDDCRKLLDVKQWGSIAWASMERAFFGCSNLNITATDVPDLSGVSNMAQMFSICTSLNSPANIGTWNTAAVTNMSGMFQQTPLFNQPLDAWNLNASVNMTNMLNNCGMDCGNYSATLIGWANNPATPSGRSLGAAGRIYNPDAVAARTNLTSTKGWTINGDMQTSTANAGLDRTDATTCGQTQVTLAANAPSVGTGTWSVVSGVGGSFSNPNSPTATFSGNAGETYTLRWTISNPPCAASTDDVTVTFNQNPLFSACPAGVTVNASSNCSATATYAAATSTVPGASITYAFGGATVGNGNGTGSGSTFNLGTTTVILLATNSCGTNTCAFSVVVQASEVNLQGNGMDIADGDNTPSSADHTDFGQTTGSNVVRTFTVQNVGTTPLPVMGIALGGTNANQFSVGTLNLASPIPAGQSATFTVIYAPNTTGVHNATVTITNGDCDEGTYAFAIRGELNCSAPTFTACPTATVDLNTPTNGCAAIANYTVSANGLPTPALTYAFTGATTGGGNGTGSGLSFNKGITTVAVTATNPCGAPTCTFSVRVTDNVPPSITCPANMTRPTTTGQCAAQVTFNNPAASDNCAAPTLQWVSGGTSTAQGATTSTGTFGKGTTTVQWKATDGAGLTKTCTFRVIVNDTEAPTMSCPSGLNVNASPGQCGASVTYSNPTYTDNCAPTSGTAVRVSGPASGSLFAVGTTNVVFRATDAASNTRQCTLTVTVVDNQPPTITCPPSMTVTGSGTPCNATAFYTAPTASDNCAGTLTPYLVSGLASGSTYPAGVMVNTWRASDPGGVTVQCAFTVTVNCPTVQPPSGAEDRGGAASDLSLAPNPAATEVAISIQGEKEVSGTLSVYDATGRLVWEQTSAATTVRLDVSAWPSGVYAVSWRQGKTILVKRLTVARG